MTAPSLTSTGTVNRAHFVAAADYVAVLLALSMPWSTSATGILAGVYVVLALPLLGVDAIETIRTRPAAWLPLALVGLGVLGMLWAHVSWHERFAGLGAFAKLLVIPLLFIHFRRSERAMWVLGAYIVACAALLVASLVPIGVPALRWLWGHSYAVPVKDDVSQSGAFLICAFAVLYLAFEMFQAGRRLASTGLLLLALLFLADIVYVNSGRTAFVTFPVLLLLLGLRLFRWKGVAIAVVAGLVVGAVAWTSSPYLRDRTTSIVSEIHQYRSSNAETSSGERLEFWKKSVRFIAAAPVIGNGTGSIPELFRRAVVGSTGASSEATTNPHNQTLAVGIELGAIGIIVLWAMWIAHLLLFFRPLGFVSWFGLVVVASSIVGSLFNSHLFDFTQGWVYVMAVGAAGGAVMRAACDSKIAVVSG